MNRVTCGMCESGPDEGMKRKKCEWSGDIRGQGAMACKAHFASSVDSELRCTRCKGSLGYFETLHGDDLCSGCFKEGLDKQERFEKRWIVRCGVVLVAGLLFFAVGYLINHG